MDRKTAIFDMDGTILDTLDDMRDSVNAALRWAGFPERTTEEVRAFVGSGAAMLIRRAVPSGTDEETVQRVLSYYRPYYQEHSLVKTAPYPGMIEALTELRDRGVGLAVVSNKPDATARLLAERCFPGLFEAVIGARDGIAVKPAPDSLREAMAILGTGTESCVYVGDSDVDILTAANAGVPCLSVTWGFRSEAFLVERGARRILRTPAELAVCILG